MNHKSKQEGIHLSMDQKNHAFGGKFIRGINNLSRWVNQNRFVSFLLAMSGAVIVSSFGSQDHTPTAPERAEWRKKQQVLERDSSDS